MLLCKFWLFITTLFLLFQKVCSKQDLSSSSFSNCQSNATILVDHAFVGFDRSTSTVTFNVSGTSTEEQKIKASLVILAYGVQVYQREFDPCNASTNVAQLCPVPVGTFAASGHQTVPANYISQIPSIAFSIPDLEGNVTLTLTSLQDGSQLGCIQSGISNGKTLQMPAVANTVTGVAVSALVVSAVSSFASVGLVGSATQSVGFGTLLGWFQTISMTGMMSVNYPPIYRSFSENFAFSTGVISWDPLQSAIDGFRSRTGGNLTQDSSNFLQHATLAFNGGESSAPALFSREPAIKTADILNNTHGVSFSSNNSTNTSSTTGAVHVVHGIEAFAEQLTIPQSNVFMTALLIFAIMIAATTVGILLLKLILEIWAIYGSFPKCLASFRTSYWTILAKTIVNLILLLYGIWVTWCIFQFTLRDSWAVKIVAAVTLSIFTAVLIGFAIRIVVIARRYKKVDGDASGLYENKETWLKYSVFYDSYKKSKWWTFIPFIIVSFARGAILAAGNGHGLVQTTAQLGLEITTFFFLLWNRPFATTAANWINITIQTVRLLSVVCVLVFVEQLGIAQTAKSITGVTLMVIQGGLSVLLVILIAINGLIAVCKQNPHHKHHKDIEKEIGRRGDLTSLSPHDSLLALRQPGHYR